MPKAFSEQEKTQIKAALQEQAKRCLSLYGVKKTTVDELVKGANIPKGTFYLFYESKEMLLFEVLQSLHDQMQNALTGALSEKNLTSEKLTDILFSLFQQAEKTDLLKLLTSGEVQQLMRKLPESVLKNHEKEDTKRTEQLFSRLGLPPNKIGEITAALRAIFLCSLHRAEVGEFFDGAIRLIIFGVAKEIFGERI